jgi:hypothetical protein
MMHHHDQICEALQLIDKLSVFSFQGFHFSIFRGFFEAAQRLYTRGLGADVMDF